jgi:hypothetical protein
VEPVADCEDPKISQVPADNAKIEVHSDAKRPENTPPMLDVHAPHEALHTWKGFFIHIATIVVGLFIAVALEQSVEALHRSHEVAALREDLRTEIRQIIADSRESEAAHRYELGWLKTRIAQSQEAVRKRSPIRPSEPNQMPRYASPDIPIWRSAKVGGRTALLTKGEVNAYGEIEYIQAHLDEAEAEKNTAERAVRSFNREFPALPDGSPDLGGASPEDLHTYLRLLSTAYEAMGNYLYWLDILTGAESAVAAGKTTLADIYAAERQASERDAQHSM